MASFRGWWSRRWALLALVAAGAGCPAARPDAPLEASESATAGVVRAWSTTALDGGGFPTADPGAGGAQASASELAQRRLASLSVTLPHADADAGVEAPPSAPALPHPEGNDLTAPCRSNAECNFGACYVPGPGPEHNPICSKRCETDADCPADARCAQPLGCTNGETECWGRGYCFRACSSDTECTAWNPSGTGADGDRFDANPVACVSWVDTGAEPTPPPIAICIQRSEP